MDEYVLEFKKIVVMIHHILKEQLTFLFIEGLIEHYREWSRYPPLGTLMMLLELRMILI